MKPEIFLVTGEINTGKTTRLKTWAINQKNFFGILTPKEGGIRLFENVSSAEKWPMEAVGEEEFLEVGRYRFSKMAFQKAEKVIIEAIDANGERNLILDEIGPLELRDYGFAELLKIAIEKAEMDSDLKLIVVVRTGLVEEVSRKFGLAFTGTI